MNPQGLTSTSGGEVGVLEKGFVDDVETLMTDPPCAVLDVVRRSGLTSLMISLTFNVDSIYRVFRHRFGIVGGRSYTETKQKTARNIMEG